MDEKQLIEFLKNNLRIDIETGTRGITVELYLGETLISQAKDDLDFVQIRY